MNSNVKTAVLEFLRLVVLAIPSFLVGLAVQAWTNDPQFSTGIGAIVLGILKSYDRSVHENPTTPSTGIVPF